MANRLIRLVSSEASVSLDEARKHLRMEGTTHDDEYIQDLCVVAQQYFETMTKTAVFHQERRSTERGLSTIQMPHPPFISVEEVLVGGQSTEEYIVHLDKQIAAIELTRGVGSSDTVEVNYICGFTSHTPLDIKHALKIIISTLYENRESVITGTIVSKIPAAVMGVMKNHMVYRL